MNAKRITFLALAAMTLASCSFSINIPSSSSASSSSVSSAATSSSVQATSFETGDLTKKEIKQTYVDYTENNCYPIDSAPTEGTCKVLVIPIWFTDSNKYILTSSRENVREDIEAAYFGSSSDTGWHSVKSYYEAESKGQLTIQGTVSEWYEIGKSVSTYAPESSLTKTETLATDAADWYFANHTDEKRSDYDSDGDGYLDAVMLIYAAPDYATLDSDDSNLWAYCFWIQDSSVRNVSSPGVNTFFWASYDFMYGAEKSFARTGKAYGGGDTDHCAIDAHTYIHEMGHVFGLDDYYDYGANGYSPAAGFSMQDLNVGGHDPFSVMAFGWADPYIPTESCQITIGAFQHNHDLVLLTPSWNSVDSPFDEYLLLELYTPTGLNQLDCTYAYSGYYPKGPSVPGIRVWHVDSRLTYVKKDGNFNESQLTADANYDCYYGVTAACSNTTGDEDYGSPFGIKSDFDSYNLLQLIRNSSTASYFSKSELKTSDLFRDGDTFSMSSFGGQFYNRGLLNSGKSLGWSFSVSISGSGDGASATLTLTKE